MGFVADVFKATLIDTNTDEAFASATLTEGNIEVEMSENEIRGGRNNHLLAVLHSSRDVSISLSDASINYDFMTRQLGTDIVTGAGVAYAMPKYFEVVDDGAGAPIVTLDNAPVSSDNGLYIETVDGQEITGYTVSGSDVDFSAASPTIAIGDTVHVLTYKYDTDASTETIVFDSEKFPKGVKAILETIEINGNEEITHRLQYQFDQAVPQGGFSVETSSERTGSTQSLNLRVVKPETSTEVGRLLRIPYTG